MADPAVIADGVSWTRFVLATVAVSLLLGGMAFGLRWLAARGWGGATASGVRRIRVTETLPLDARRRLVMVRCDGREHLLLLGINSDVVIASSQAASSEATGSKAFPD